MERLYEQCSALLALSLRLIMVAQVYGGSMSLVVGAYLTSVSFGASRCVAGGTVVSELSIVLYSNRIFGSRALTLTTGGTNLFVSNAALEYFIFVHTFECSSFLGLQRTSYTGNGACTLLVST